MKKILLIRKFVFIITLFVMIITMVGCTNKTLSKNITFKDTSNFTTLSKVQREKTTYKSYYDYKQKDNLKRTDFNFLNDFYIKTMSQLFKENKNYVYSPISLYMALAMLLNGSDGETKEEIKDVLGVKNMNLLDLNRYLQKIYEHNNFENDSGMCQMANSIWISKDLNVLPNYVNTLEKSFYADTYHTNFDDEGKENIIKWINNYTKNLLHLTKDNYKISDNIVLALINTLYFDNKWEEEYETKMTKEGIFYSTDKEVNAMYMNHVVNSMAYFGDNYTESFDFFKNGYKIRYILPDEGIDVLDLINENVLNLKEYQNYKVTYYVPRFEINTKIELNDILKQLGMKKAFTNQADFSLTSDGNLFVGIVKQDTTIKLSEEGVKAASVTFIGECKSSAPIDDKLTMRLNRPFIYCLYDEYDVMMFSGIVNNPLNK